MPAKKKNISSDESSTEDSDSSVDTISSSESDSSKSSKNDSSKLSVKNTNQSIKKKSGDLTGVTDENVKKKRGRPRKNTVVRPTILEKPIVEKSEKIKDTQLILHIPLYDEDDEDSSDKNNMFTMKSEDDDDIDDKIIKSLSHSDNDIDVKKLLLELKKKDAIIKRLKVSSADSKFNDVHDNTPSFTKDTKTKLVNLKLINTETGKLIVVDKTDIACWWCAHNFTTLPCFIPDRYSDEIFYVFGCFCTYSCALAYNLNMNDHRSSGRISLIKKLYAKIFSTSENINVAPPKEITKKFGGPLTIEEFRNTSLMCKKEFKMSLPPMIPLIATMEELQKDQNTNYLGHKQPMKKK